MHRVRHATSSAGVTPGQGRREVRGAVPVFDTVAEAREGDRRQRDVIFVPPPGAADAILEAVDAGIALVVCITEGIPVARHARDASASSKGHAQSRLIGPNCPGIITPGAVQDRHHAGPHPQGRAHRRRLALGHAHLRGRRPADALGHRPVDLHRHRRRSGQRHGLRRRARALQARPGHARRHHDRRDRRRRRRRSRRRSSRRG